MVAWPGRGEVMPSNQFQSPSEYLANADKAAGSLARLFADRPTFRIMSYGQIKRKVRGLPDLTALQISYAMRCAKAKTESESPNA